MSEELKEIRKARKRLSCEISQWNLLAVVQRCTELEIDHGVDLFRGNYLEIERTVGQQLRGKIVDHLHPLPAGAARSTFDFIY